MVVKEKSSRKKDIPGRFQCMEKLLGEKNTLPRDYFKGNNGEYDPGMYLFIGVLWELLDTTSYII